ncbi:ThrC Threonine synthase [Burkholderiaceae bacterium]|jgi:threonine synthase
MLYQSTRGKSPQVSFQKILLGGLAPDGGLYLPVRYPTVSLAQLDAWRKLSYADLAYEILRLYCDDIPAADLRALTHKTYSAAVYCNGRQTDLASDITPLHYLGEEQGTTLSLLSLSNGPTLAFKDMAMQLLGNLFEYVLQQTGQQLNILGATSGDTGSAAEYAMRGKAGIQVFMLSPQGKMSAFQAAQMYSLCDANIYNLAVNGVFDDCQDIVKAVSNDLEFKDRHHIGTVNSINWGRVVAQIVYYFQGYFLATKSNAERVSFAVPSGNFGNICAGHIARMMGLPIERLVLATNENNVLDDFFRTGIYRARKAVETLHTSSPSMDISKASNFERFIFDLLGQDGQRTAALFKQVDETGGFNLSADPTFHALQQFGFVSGSSSHQNRLETIRQIDAQYGVMIDPHTADGVQVARRYLQADIPMIVLETALPIKFEETIEAALGRPADCPLAFQSIKTLPQRVQTMAPDIKQVKSFITSHPQ